MPIGLHVDTEIALGRGGVVTNVTTVWFVAARIRLSPSQSRVRSRSASTVRAPCRRGRRRRRPTQLRLGPVDRQRVLVDGCRVLLAHVDLQRLAVLVVPVAARTLEQLGGPAART